MYNFRCLINNFFLVNFFVFFPLQAKRENEPEYQQTWLFKVGAALECSFPTSERRNFEINHTTIELQSIRFKTQNRHSCYIHLLICLCLLIKVQVNRILVATKLKNVLQFLSNWNLTISLLTRITLNNFKFRPDTQNGRKQTNRKREKENGIQNDWQTITFN